MRTPASPVRTTLPGRPPRRLTATAAALALGLGLVALGGCSAGSSDESAPAMGDSSAAGSADGPGGDLASKGYSEEGAAVAPPANAQAEPGTDGTTTVDPATVDPSTVAASVTDRQLARRADISVTVKDVDAAATKVRAIATGAQGLVLSESIASESEGDIAGTGGFSSITISVPTAQLDATLDRVAAIGEVYSRNTSTEDVTAQVVDTQSRLKTMQASVERVRALMTQATKLGEIVTLEAELSRRQADLEALQTQLAALEDSVALAPVEVRLSTDAQVLAEAEDDTGFLAGLTAGWRAFTASVTMLLTVLGAMLPFAVAAALVIAPVVLWLRRRPVPTPTMVPAPAGPAAVASPTPPPPPAA